jgi:hypothetical protein
MFNEKIFDFLRSSFLKNKKGQAFSTFQLLIAAVVALALLGVLMPIIMRSIDIGGDPSQATQQLLKSQIDNPGTLSFTDDVTFSSKYNTLSASGVANDTGLDAGQIVFATNGLDDTFSTIGTSASKIEYSKTQKGKYRLGVLCDSDAAALVTSVDDYKASNKIDDSVSVTATNFADPSVTCCLIFPKRAQ